MPFSPAVLTGCENLEHVTTASLPGVRESRRIVGEYELTIEDHRNRRQFPDQIGVYNKSINIHAKRARCAEWKRFRHEYQ